ERAAAKAGRKAVTKAKKKKGGKGRGGPCDHLKKGNPDRWKNDRGFRGGSYGGTAGTGKLYNQSHHQPADSASPLATSQGPAGQMLLGDHAETRSFGASREALDFQERIRQMISEGRWRDAMAEEIRDVRRVAREAGDSTRYNQMELEKLAYF